MPTSTPCSLSSTFVPTYQYFNKMCSFLRWNHIFSGEQTHGHASLHWPNEIQCSLGHWSTSLILSQEYSWPAHPPTHTRTHTSVVRHRASKWGQRWLVVIHLTSVTAAANKSLIHRLIHRLSPPNSLKTMPSQNTVPAAEQPRIHADLSGTAWKFSEAPSL